MKFNRSLVNVSFEIWTVIHTITLHNNIYENITLVNIFEYNLTVTPENRVKVLEVKKDVYIFSTSTALKVVQP